MIVEIQGEVVIPMIATIITGVAMKVTDVILAQGIVTTGIRATVAIPKQVTATGLVPILQTVVVLMDIPHAAQRIRVVEEVLHPWTVMK